MGVNLNLKRALGQKESLRKPRDSKQRLLLYREKGQVPCTPASNSYKPISSVLLLIHRQAIKGQRKVSFLPKVK